MVRRQFAEKANQVGPWIERQMDAVTAIGMGLQVGDMNQLKSLFSICTNLIQNKNNTNVLNSFNQINIYLFTKK